jgi:hypothetical protein
MIETFVLAGLGRTEQCRRGCPNCLEEASSRSSGGRRRGKCPRGPPNEHLVAIGRLNVVLASVDFADVEPFQMGSNGLRPVAAGAEGVVLGRSAVELLVGA